MQLNLPDYFKCYTALEKLEGTGMEGTKGTPLLLPLRKRHAVNGILNGGPG